MSERTFSWALDMVKTRVACRRRAWKPNKVLILDEGDHLRMPHLTLVYEDGRRIPWIPVQCDMLVDDWEASWEQGDG